MSDLGWALIEGLLVGVLVMALFHGFVQSERRRHRHDQSIKRILEK